MNELEQAIAKTVANGLMTAGYHDAADYVLSDWMAGAISRATGQLVPAQTWQPMETAPLGTTKTVEGPKGPREVHVREVVFCASDCGKVTQSYWIPKEGRWCMFAKDHPPIGWHPLPRHPAPPVEGAEG